MALHGLRMDLNILSRIYGAHLIEKGVWGRERSFFCWLDQGKAKRWKGRDTDHAQPQPQTKPRSQE